MCWYTCTLYGRLLGEGIVEHCVLSSQIVGGLVLTPASASRAYSCTAAPSLTSHHVWLRVFLHHRYSTPWICIHVEAAGAPLTDQNTLSDKGAGSPGCIPPLDCLRPLSEPKRLMCNVSLHCCTIGGPLSHYLLQVLLDFSGCFTLVWEPACTCMIRLLTAYAVR